MTPKPLRLLAALLFTLSTIAAHAQFGLFVDSGQQNTTYGSNYDTAYKQQTNNVQFADLGVYLLLAPHAHHKYGYNFTAMGDINFPFQHDATTGGVTSFGGAATFNLRYRLFTVGSGLDAHYYLFPNGVNNTNNRPSELLLGIPILAKFSFGPGGKAFIQGGGTLYVTSNATTSGTDSFGDTVTVTNAFLELSKTHTSGEIRASAGYFFGHFGLRANYINRDVYFDVTGNPTFKSYYDFHEQTVSGGIVLIHF